MTLMPDCLLYGVCFFFFSSRRRHTRLQGDWSSDVCSSDLPKRATTGAPTPVAMCITPVSPETTTRERASRAPVSWSENSPAALAAAPPATSCCASPRSSGPPTTTRSEEHTSELQSPCNLVCRLLLEK